MRHDRETVGQGESKADDGKEGKEAEQVKEKQILFSTPMVRAILEGRKTQTRRVIKPQPQRFFEVNEEPLYLYDVEWNLGSIYPKYQPGDILWVRETWGVPISLAGDIIYKADFVDRKAPLADGEKWRPSIFMPKEAARLWLEVKSARVERIDEASEADALAEGVDTINKFIILWNKFNGKKGFLWSSRCWVWVVEFQRVSEL